MTTTGSSADIVRRIHRVLPKRWFQWGAPIRDAILGGLSDSAAWCYDLIGYARAQTRLATAYGVWLDIFALDFLGRYLQRNGAPDDTFRAQIKATVLRERVTRKGMVNAVTALTGKAPWIFEPWNTGDTGAYSSRWQDGTTNLLTYSQQFNNAAWGITGLLPFGSGSTANAAIAPDGTVTADHIVVDATANVHRLNRGGWTFPGGQPYAIKIFAKAAEYNFLRIEFYRGATTGAAHFNLTTGAIGEVSNASWTNAEYVGAGWWECSVGFVTDGPAQVFYVYPIPSMTSGNNWTGDGASGIYVWGAQLEAGAESTTYLATTNTPATRSAINGFRCGQLGYGIGQGGYGSMVLPAQTFMRVNFGAGAGIPNVAGYGTGAAGYGVGAAEYAGPTVEKSGVTLPMIYDIINKTKPTGTICWVAVEQYFTEFDPKIFDPKVFDTATRDVNL
jgi:hypothetical protein